MKIQKDMNRYKFQIGGELPPEIMQQMQGMPMEQGIPMEQGVPVEQGNGEASFAQQLMVIEQQIDKIQKEMKKLEKRDDKLAKNEYRRLEQQLAQLEQQKEMLRAQVEQTRQQLEQQEQMQGDEYIDPNAQYEMSPEELDALELQYQEVPDEEQINPEEMQMMQYGGKMQTGTEGDYIPYMRIIQEPVDNSKSAILNKFKERADKIELEKKETEENRYWNGLRNKYVDEYLNKVKPYINKNGYPYVTKQQVNEAYDYADKRILKEKELNKKPSLPQQPFVNTYRFGGKMQTAGGLNSRKIYRKEDYVEPNVMWYDNMPQSVIDGYEFIHPDNRLGNDNFKLTYVDNPIKRTSIFPRPSSIDNADQRLHDIIAQQDKENKRTRIQNIRDYFGDIEPINIAQATIPFIGAMDNSHAIGNEIAKNMKYSYNPYAKGINDVNEMYDAQQYALERNYNQQVNQLKRDANSTEIQPRSTFGRSANMQAINRAYNENKDKLEANFQSNLATMLGNKMVGYGKAFNQWAETELENQQLNYGRDVTALKEEGVRRKEIYDQFQEGLNRIAEIIQGKKDFAYLNTEWYKNLTDKEKAEVNRLAWLIYFTGPAIKGQQKQSGATD